MALMDVANREIWQALRLYLPLGTRLTSVYRSPESQLSFIVRKAKKHGYTFADPPTVADKSTWQAALVFIRSKGYKVAAPGVSKHQHGLAYDLSGPNLNTIEAGVRKAVAAGAIKLLSTSKRPILREPKNHCVHVEVESANIDYEPFDTA